MLRYLYFALLAGIHFPVAASDSPGTVSSTGGLFQVLLVLVLVLALMLGAAWLLKRFNLSAPSQGKVIKIIGGVAVGSRERIMVVEVADQWIVVGVTPGQINALSTLPRQETSETDEAPTVSGNFAVRLKQLIEKRNEK